jgi:hypothetical protein
MTTALSDFHLEKLVWDDQDFEVMGWHDATLWSTLAMRESYEFLVDLDYIFSWVPPAPGETYFKFWVAPVTMVFENASDIVLDIKSSQGSIEVADLHRNLLGPSPNDKFTQFRYTFECQEGTVSLEATGFKMHVRRLPTLVDAQSLDFSQRGGVSFDRVRNDYERLAPADGQASPARR